VIRAVETVGFQAEGPKGRPLRKSRFSETQIVSILKEHDASASFVELGRRHGVHLNMISAWKAKYGGVKSSEIAPDRAIEAKNARMRRILAKSLA
jgi:putative transposase